MSDIQRYIVSADNLFNEEDLRSPDDVITPVVVLQYDDYIAEVVNLEKNYVLQINDLQARIDELEEENVCWQERFNELAKEAETIPNRIQDLIKSEGIKEMLYKTKGYYLPEICEPIKQKKYAFLLVRDIHEYADKLEK